MEQLLCHFLHKVHQNRACNMSQSTSSASWQQVLRFGFHSRLLCCTSTETEPHLHKHCLSECLCVCLGLLCSIFWAVSEKWVNHIRKLNLEANVHLTACRLERTRVNGRNVVGLTLLTQIYTIKEKVFSFTFLLTHHIKSTCSFVSIFSWSSTFCIHLQNCWYRQRLAFEVL